MTRTRYLAPLVALGLVLAACTSTSPSASPGTSSGPSASAGESMNPDDLTGQSVTIIATWGDAEEEAFLAMVKPWEDATGATVKYTGTRDINTILTTGVASGVLPDLAGLPGPGQMAEYAAAGALLPLDDVLDIATYTAETAPGLVSLGQSDGSTYGVFIKASVKGLIWFNPYLYDYTNSAPATWDDLLSQGAANQGSAQALWCVGIESGAASGWPATDWVEQIVLHQSGPDVYNSWWAGDLAWDSPEIRSAFETYMNDVVGKSFGGGTNVVATSFLTAGDPLFTDPQGCEFFHQASFITGLGDFPNRTAGTDYNAFPFPSINAQYAAAVEGAGDLFGMFHDTPAARSLMKYLVTADAQNVWVRLGGALSANKNANDYPDAISATMGSMVANAEMLVFDASDQMPAAMNEAFWSNMVSLTNGSITIDQALAALDAIRADAYGG